MYTINEKFEITFKVKRIILKRKNDFFKIFKATILKQEAVSGGENYLKHEETIYVHAPVLEQGDTLQGTVQIKLNKQFGYYLEMTEEPSVIMPDNKNELIVFLTKKLKGVGRKTATKLVDAYGMDVLIEIQENDEAFSAVGISKARGAKIKEQLSFHQAFEKLSTFLYSIDIPIKFSASIYDSLGRESLTMVQKNPYIIAGIRNVGFPLADIVANSLERNPLSLERMKAGVISYIEQKMNSGDICVKKEMLMKEIKTFLTETGDFQEYENDKISNELILTTLKELEKETKIVTETSENGTPYIYFKKFLNIEDTIVNKVTELRKEFRTPIAQKGKVSDYIERLENGGFLSEEDRIVGKTPFKLDSIQKDAVYMAMSSNISILTGGPGTGKTQTVNTIVEALKYANPSASISLLAPTGKASKRMSELTHMPSMTIHRKLKLFGDGSDDVIEKIEEDLIIIDEISMVDAELFYSFICNIGENSHVLLVGDVDQLPSIGPGLILRDLIDSSAIPVTKLTTVFRQAKNSQIVMNAHKLNKGLTTLDEDGITFDMTKKDMYFIRVAEETNIRNMILKSIRKQMNVYGRNISEICVLSPMRVGGLGTIELNKHIQKMINPQKKGVMELEIEKEETITYRTGDRVMQLTNDDEKNVTNGETGIIEKIYTDLVENEETGTVTSKNCIDVVYQDLFVGTKTVTYTEDELNDIELAYAISIHKSQGSEFPIVIMPFHYSQKNMLKRNLIYTAWTRAKGMLVCIGNMSELNQAIGRMDDLNRVSLLKEKLRNNR